MNQNALFNRGLNNENVYGNQQRKMKRNRYYQLKVLKGECGVVSIKSKPWFCGENRNSIWAECFGNSTGKRRY